MSAGNLFVTLFTEIPITASLLLTAILSDWWFSQSATPQLHFPTTSAKPWPSTSLISVAWRLGTWRIAIFILFVQPFLGRGLWQKRGKEAKSSIRTRASYYKAKLEPQRYLLFWKGHLRLTFWKSHGKINPFPSQPSLYGFEIGFADLIFIGRKHFSYKKRYSLFQNHVSKYTFPFQTPLSGFSQEIPHIFHIVK